MTPYKNVFFIKHEQAVYIVKTVFTYGTSTLLHADAPNISTAYRVALAVFYHYLKLWTIYALALFVLFFSANVQVCNLFTTWQN